MTAAVGFGRETVREGSPKVAKDVESAAEEQEHVAISLAGSAGPKLQGKLREAKNDRSVVKNFLELIEKEVSKWKLK